MKPKITRLNNGLRIATDFMSDVESASISIWINTGSRNETKKDNGISHFLEHMAFKGTEKRSAKQIAEEFDNIGGKVNAFTSREYTVYYAKILKDNIGTAMEILSDIIQNSTYKKEELENERKVILQEIAMTKDTPDDIIFDYYQSKAFPNQPFGRSILGTSANIKSFKRKDLIKHVQDHYLAGDMIISIAGKSRHSKNVRLVRKYFSDIKKGSNNKFDTAEYKGGDFRKEKKLEQAHIVFGFQGYSYKTDKFYTSNILSSVLGGGMSSRLFQEIREKKGLCYTIYSMSSSYYDTGSFKIYAGVSPKKTNELIDAVIKELKKIANKISQKELKRSVAQCKASILMARESTTARSRHLGSDLFAYSRVRTIKEIIKKIESIKVKDLQNLMEEILSSSPTLALLGNVKNTYEYDEVIKKLK